jgi:hypothetical protein
MIDGASSAGERTFTLPATITGRTLEVVGENRSIRVADDGTFRDAFAHEYTYHVYKIAL